MARKSIRVFTRLERLEAVVQPDGCCPACGFRPHPVRAIVIRLCTDDEATTA
jgi:hypothetical protein